jgi:hypothetical protein
VEEVPGAIMTVAITTTITTMTSREFNQDTGGAKRAAQRGPVYVTDRGRVSHVLLRFDDYERLTHGGGIVERLGGPAGVEDVEFEVPARSDRAAPATFD